MKNSRLFLSVILCGLVLTVSFSAQSFAGKKKNVPETYLATESESEPESKSGSPAPQTVPFDPVPATQSGAILARIKLVEVLVQKYGRAYDYRSHTLKQLQAILQDLQETETSGSAPVTSGSGS